MHASKKVIHHVVIAFGLLWASHAIAQSLNATKLKIEQGHVKATHKADAKTCQSQAGNAKDICLAEANGKKAIAMAELSDQYQPTLKSQYQLSLAKGQATYDVAKEKCDDLSGNQKDVCVQTANAAWVTAKAEAEVRMKTTASNREANQIADETQDDADADNQA